MSRHAWLFRNSPVVIAALVAGLLSAAMWRGLSSPPPAYGQIPDSGLQRDTMIKEMRIQSEKLTEIAGLLREIRDRQPPVPARPDRHGGE